MKSTPKIEAKKKEVAKIIDLIKKGKAKFVGDVSLVDLSQSRAEAKKKMDEPKFVKVVVDKVWGKWGRKDRRGNKGGFYVHWSAKGIGFGELTFFMGFDGKLHCRSECMGRNFVKKALAALVDQCVWDE